MTGAPPLLATVRAVEKNTDRLLSRRTGLSRAERSSARRSRAHGTLDHLSEAERGLVLAVADAFHQASREIVGVSRRRPVVAARAALATILREAGYSLPMIGRALKRDHTSVMHLLSDECMARRQPDFLDRLAMARGARP